MTLLEPTPPRSMVLLLHNTTQYLGHVQYIQTDAMCH